MCVYDTGACVYRYNSSVHLTHFIYDYIVIKHTDYSDYIQTLFSYDT